MAAYLLPCVCGKTVPVDVGQAGGQVVCTCGTRLEVPTLRQLRHMPPVPTEELKGGSAWGQRQGVMAAGLILALLLFGWGAWVWHKQPQIPEFDPAVRMHAVEEQMKSPLGAWESWIGYYRPLAERGLQPFHIANANQIQARIDEDRFLRYLLCAMAACFLVIAACAALWPKPVPRKQRA